MDILEINKNATEVLELLNRKEMELSDMILTLNGALGFVFAIKHQEDQAEKVRLAMGGLFTNPINSKPN